MSAGPGMLRRVRVRDLALIEELTLDLGAGLNVISGETGAGKSLIHRALAMVAGHRVGAEVVRAGADAAEVEAEIDVDLARDPALSRRLADLGLPLEGGRLIVRRTVARAGRGQVQANGKSVALATLAELGASFLRLQGQHESLDLIRPEHHLSMLDSAIEIEALRARYAAAWESLDGLVRRLDALERGAAERERYLEIVRFDCRELEDARLEDPEEEGALAADRVRLQNVERLAAAVEQALSRLHGEETAALGGVESMARRIAECAELDPELSPIAATLEEAAAPLAEAVRGLQAYAASLEADPRRLEAVEERLALLGRLERKHRVEGLAALIARRDSLVAELAASEADAADPAALRAEVERTADRAWSVARELTAERRRGASRLDEAVSRELGALGMPGARFAVRVEDLPAGPTRGAASVLTRDGAGLGPDGADRVEFDLEANPGEGARPLARVASGGELSRIMLALRHVTGGDARASLVFDEVDAGIGGAAAEVVGRRLRGLARHSQVICITHLAQIAVFASQHYAVEKEARAGRTHTRAVAVTGEARLRELARMLGGDPERKASLEHAAALLRAADTGSESEPARDGRAGGAARGREAVEGRARRASAGGGASEAMPPQRGRSRAMAAGAGGKGKGRG